ncbi:MAG: hypothetical protein O7H41_04275 [Planctomycetota bacterium]|nr:hypothetical protein [Planctomycetota bacterium]
MSGDNIVHVVGTGTIGEPLIGLLAGRGEELGIDEVTFHKRTPLVLDRSKVKDLIKRGAKLCVDPDRREEFKKLGMEPTYDALTAIERAKVVIDCTPSGVGQANKASLYNDFMDNTLGFIAQGSEFGFGKMYARGINDEALESKEDRFLHVVSCNTHNIAALANTLAMEGEGPSNLERGRFICIRRANDISQEENFIPSPAVGRHKDKKFGTHHARDAHHLFKTLGHDLDLHSSAIKINTQYMHILHFNLRVKKKITLEEVKEKIATDDRICVTEKMSSGLVFSFGRDHGYYGRILNQTVISIPTLQVHDGHEIVGFCFTPQDGNSLLSSIAGALWFLYPDTYSDRIQCLKDLFFDEV